MTFVLGHRPYWILRVNGRAVWMNGIHISNTQGGGANEDQPDPTWSEHDCAIERLDVELGINQVQTCTFDIIGEDAAYVAQKLFPRMAEVEVLMGYDYFDSDSEDAVLMFAGYVMQGFPSGTYPAIVEIHCDSDLFRLRELEVTEGDENVPDHAEFLKNFVPEKTGLTLLVDSKYANLAPDEGGSIEGNALENIFSWLQDNHLHLFDTMDSNIHFFYPHSPPIPLFGGQHRTWELLYKGDKSKPDIAPVLRSWKPTMNYVDAPSQVSITWLYQESPEDDPVATPLSVDIEGGVDGAVIQLGFIDTATVEEAQKYLEDWARTITWMSVTGTFALSVGLPIQPFHTIIPRNGPLGLEDFYDKAFQVIRVHHTWDSRGWLVKGEIRGQIGE